MKQLFFLIVMVLYLTGCSGETAPNRDVLSEAAEVNFYQPFQLDEQLSVTIAVEQYEYGRLKDDKSIYFGNHFSGAGAVQFAIFRQDFSPQLFLIGAIQDDEQTISSKQLLDTSEWGFIFKEQQHATLTKPGEYRIGLYGSLSEEDATSFTSPPQLTIENKQDFVEAYKRFPVLYVVVAHVQ